MEGTTNTRITPSELEAYFKAVEQPFAETRREFSRGNSTTGLVGLLGLGFFFSLILVIPFLLSKLAFILFGSRVINFRNLQVHLSSFWLWWITSLVVSFSLLVVVIRFARAGKADRERWLSTKQMRFAYCYGAMDEIRRYRTTHLGRHIETALDYLNKIGTALMRASTLDLAEGLYPYHYWQSEETGYHRSVGVRVDRPKWYRLQPETEVIVRAFPKFLPRLTDRLKDRKDLAVVESALNDLAYYLYTEIPELSEGKSLSDLEQMGMESLLRFARQINDLPPYRSEPNPSPKEKVSLRVIAFGRRLSALFGHDNLLISFFAWYLLMLLLFGGGFYLAFRYVPTLKMDSTIIATIVGGPVATAVTAVAIPRLAKVQKRQE